MGRPDEKMWCGYPRWLADLYDGPRGIEPAFEKSYERRFRVGIRDVVQGIYRPVGKVRVAKIAETGSPDEVELTLVPAAAEPGGGSPFNRLLVVVPRRGAPEAGRELELGAWDRPSED